MANLSKGAKGKPVAQLQKALNKRGAKPKLKEDSSFGPLTDTALRTFQKKNKMKPDGIAGPNTSFALGLGSRPKSLKWPIKNFDPSKELKLVGADIKEVDDDFKKYVNILKAALADNDSLKKALIDRAKMLAERKKIVGKIGAELMKDGNQMLKLQQASEKSNNFSEIKEMYKQAEEIYSRIDDADIDTASSHIKAFDKTIVDIEEYQEGVKALKSKLKKGA